MHSNVSSVSLQNIWAKLASISHLGIISDTHINFKNSQNGRNDPKSLEIIN